LAKVVCEANNEIKRREQIANDLPLWA
jgi:hypothetical protein